MPKTKPIANDGERLVKRKDVDLLLSRFASMADAAMNAKIAQLKSELLAELTPKGAP